MNDQKSKPIQFSGPMVRAILEGWKTQTRRVFKTSNGGVWPNPNYLPGMKQIMRECPYGQPGDRLWVREKFKTVCDDGQWDCIEYADGTRIHPKVPDHNTGFRFSWDCDNDNVRWRPSIYMPRWASRINLEITAI